MKYLMELCCSDERYDSPVIIQTAEASELEKVRVRCRVDGAIHPGNPDLSWVFKGELLQQTDTLKIETDTDS